MKHKQFILFYDLQASARIENKYSLNQTLQNANKTRLRVSALTHPNYRQPKKTAR